MHSRVENKRHCSKLIQGGWVNMLRKRWQQAISRNAAGTLRWREIKQVFVCWEPRLLTLPGRISRISCSSVIKEAVNNLEQYLHMHKHEPQDTSRIWAAFSPLLGEAGAQGGEKGTALACALGTPCRSKKNDLFSPSNLPQMPEQILGRAGNTKGVVLGLMQDMEQGQV